MVECHIEWINGIAGGYALNRDRNVAKTGLKRAVAAAPCRRAQIERTAAEQTVNARHIVEVGKKRHCVVAAEGLQLGKGLAGVVTVLAVGV